MFLRHWLEKCLFCRQIRQSIRQSIMTIQIGQSIMTIQIRQSNTTRKIRQSNTTRQIRTLQIRQQIYIEINSDSTNIH